MSEVVEMTGRVHSIESFGTVDGPGTRFVVFLQGCPMRCLYCHNPDTWNPNEGQERTVEDIMAELEKTKGYYKNGGITVTGGEPLMQIDFVIELFTAAKKKGIHTCLDTSGIMFNKNNEELVKKYDCLMEVTDLIMLDIKHIDPEEHVKLTAQKIDHIIDFIRYIDEKTPEIWIRHVVVPTITYKEEYLKKLGVFLASIHRLKALDVLPYHTMGEVKYQQLGMDYPLKGLEALDKSEAIKAKEIILTAFREERKRMREEA